MPHDPDRPTRRELRAEAFADRVREEHIRDLRENDGWYRQVLDRDLGPDCLTTKLATHGTFLQRLVGAIHARMACLENDRDALKEMADALAESDSIARDPCRHYGIPGL